ncbi:MAG: 2-C-methyl-D-erythritol 4-phosphate cytidylyltransferase [Chloroflexota bacterium]|nr:2-C-methyl-D-erythritol 4-phosphate cytidylyltransferase [Chloroflexota bacterium]
MTLPPPDRVAAVVVAAGRGQRLAAPDKVLLPLAGQPMLAWSLAAIAATPQIGTVVVVAGEHTMAAVAALVQAREFHKVAAIVPGGERRQDSVAAGLAALPSQTEVVLIHDGARPLADAGLFRRCAEAAAATGAVIAAMPVADTLKRVTDADRVISGTVDRSGLWAAQTPQAFRLEVLQRAFTSNAGADVTDEALLCEAAGIPVRVVPSSSANLKVTHPEDVAVADALLRARLQGGDRDPGLAASQERAPLSTSFPPFRTGIGYDIHRFAPGRRLVLGGVELPHDLGLDGHSDADVLLHAIADAILGAAALGDIGQHFPPGDARFHDADSQDLLRASVRLARDAGWAPANIDATLLAEAPRIGPHVPLMRERIAACIGLTPDAVGVKATTNETLGAIGRREGIAALAVATLYAVQEG